MKTYYVYIMSSISGTLYTGMTNDLERRIFEHKEGENSGFTKKYKVKKLVYFESTNNVNDAIAREKQIKGWMRKKENRIGGIDESEMGGFESGMVQNLDSSLLPLRGMKQWTNTTRSE